MVHGGLGRLTFKPTRLVRQNKDDRRTGRADDVHRDPWRVSGGSAAAIPPAGRLVRVHVPATLSAVLAPAVALVILRVLVSIPVCAAGKLLTEGRAGFGDAMAATLGGAVVYFLVL